MNEISSYEFNDFTLFDIFNKKGFIYLIMSINNDPISHKDISVSIDNKELNFIEKYEKNSKEPTLIFLYEYAETDDVSVTIKILPGIFLQNLYLLIKKEF